MARYIDADKLIAKHTLTVRGEWDNTMTFEAVPNNYIEGAPTADVRPERHAKWAGCYYDHDGYKEQCSACKYKSKDIGMFCSNCGAIMDE